MDIQKGIDIRNSREVTTPGGIFLSFIPHLFKGERGNLIMVEKAIVKKIETGEPVLVKEKKSDKGKYFVVRTPKNGEDKYYLFTLKSGGSQDHRYGEGHFKVRNVVDGFIIHDISSSWGSNHEVLIALKEGGGCVEVEGNHGSGFKSRDPQPDFLIRLKSDGSEEHITDLDVEIEDKLGMLPEPFDQTLPKKKVKWASWAGKHIYFTLPEALKIVSELKTNRQIVMQVFTCGQEKMAKDGLVSSGIGNSRVDLNSMFICYRPAPIDLYNFNDFIELYNPQNFFVNFCVGVDLKCINSINGGSQMKPIGSGQLIHIGRNSVAEIINNNLFIYVDLVLFQNDKMLTQIIEEANKFLLGDAENL